LRKANVSLTGWAKSIFGAGGERAIEDEGGVDGCRPFGERREDVLRVRHLRHELRVDEAAGLDARHARAREPGAPLGADVRRGRHLVFLEPVPRAGSQMLIGQVWILPHTP
jgi:hypothetical protein